MLSCPEQHATMMGAKCTGTLRARRPQDSFQQERYKSIVLHQKSDEEQERDSYQNNTMSDKFYQDQCLVYMLEKIEAGYYPERNDEKKGHSRQHR